MGVPEIKPVPTDAHRRRVMLTVAAVVVGIVALAAVLLYVYLRSGEHVAPGTLPSGTIEQTVPETRTSTVPTTSVEITTSVVPTVTPVLPGRVARIAFRLGMSIDVADESGTGATPLVRSQGLFALSPDGAYLAVVDEQGLRFVRVADKAVLQTVPASADVVPVWTPDSSTVLFVRAGAVREVWRVGAAGAAELVGQGRACVVSPDGRSVALIADAADGVTGTLRVRTGSQAWRTMKLTSRPLAVALTNTAVFVAVVDPESSSEILTVPITGGQLKQFAGAPESTPVSVWGELLTSPDGGILAAAAVGDDGYSRISLFDITTRASRSLSTRRDAYPQGWSADGTALFVIEGNPDQGEPTALIRTDLDDLSRRTVVTGALP